VLCFARLVGLALLEIGDSGSGRGLLLRVREKFTAMLDLPVPTRALIASRLNASETCASDPVHSSSLLCFELAFNGDLLEIPRRSHEAQAIVRVDVHHGPLAAAHVVALARGVVLEAHVIVQHERRRLMLACVWQAVASQSALYPLAGVENDAQGEQERTNKDKRRTEAGRNWNWNWNAFLL
jgi:hypothetical protein